ncbi:MAG: tripartite tricarboxylate transporter substrate binding protein [Burkholderiales bacterium]|nr:tripartite tricarboxylate transporter substrate binding protein [Burkholderiales bacterium]
MTRDTTLVIRMLAWTAGALLSAGHPAFAQTDPAPGYPAKPMRLVVPFAPGGSTDLIARILAQKLGEAWNQQMVVDNRPGAGGTIGVDHVAKSPADGYTLIFGHVGTFGFGPSLYPKLPYHPVRDFAPVIEFAMVPNMLVTHPSLPVKTVKELVALAKAQPGKVNYASSGVGSASHLAVEYFKLLAKIDLVPIAYRGTGPMTVSLVSGETSLTITGVPPLYPHVQAGRMRGIAVASAKRLKMMPELPTITEAGVAGYESTTWFGPLAPAKTPREIIVKLNTELNRVLQQPDTGKRFAAEGIEALGGTPEQFGTNIRAEIERWARVVREANIRLD